MRSFCRYSILSNKAKITPMNLVEIVDKSLISISAVLVKKSHTLKDWSVAVHEILGKLFLGVHSVFEHFLTHLSRQSFCLAAPIFSASHSSNFK